VVTIMKNSAPSAPRGRFRLFVSIGLAGVALALGSPIATPAHATIVFPGVSPASVDRVRVTNPTELVAAMKGATRATEILLAPGAYDNMTIKSVKPTFDIVIRSENDANRATISRMFLYNCSRIRFDRVNFPLLLSPGESVVTLGIRLSASNNISFSNNNFYGSLNGNPNDDGVLFKSTSSSRVLLFNNSFQQARVAFSFERSNRMMAVSNRLQDMREGANFIVVDKTYLERNYFARIFPNLEAGDHADAMQFWPKDGKASKRVFIRNNAFILDRGSGHAIFVRSTSPSARHATFTIQHNVIYSRERQGIWLDGVTTALVENNSVVAAPDPLLEPAIFASYATGITVRRNIAPLFLAGDGASPTFSNNVDLADSRQPNQPSASSQFSGDVTVNDPLLSAFTIRPGSIAASLSAGATLGANIGGVAGTAAQIEAAFQAELQRIRSLT